MITFCLSIFLLWAFIWFIKGLLKFFGLLGEGLDGVIEGFWCIVFGGILTTCGVLAFIKLYNIHISFG